MPIFYVLEVQNVRQIVNSIQGVYDVAVLKTATHIDLHTRHTACFCMSYLFKNLHQQKRFTSERN